MSLPVPSVTLAPIERLREIMHLLRQPGGCPWDQEQTHESLIPNLIEEAYEVAAAIRSDDVDHLKEELGDLLLQVVFHTEIGGETEETFTFDAVCEGISEKLIRRHPHVFGERDAASTDAVLKQWEEIKAEERKAKGQDEVAYLDKVGEGFPGVLKAKELQKKAAKVGFDWLSPEGAWEKVDEELAEVIEARDAGNQDALAEEMGDLFFALINAARLEGCCAESVVDAANQKFTRRFGQVEKLLKENGLTLEEASLEEMDSAWDQAKAMERK
ncbi:MAG: nucleoside triphosphate pyrophosphohydrolase [Verrucomicrobiota bacterium]